MRKNSRLAYGMTLEWPEKNQKKNDHKKTLKPINLIQIQKKIAFYRLSEVQFLHYKMMHIICQIFFSGHSQNKYIYLRKKKSLWDVKNFGSKSNNNNIYGIFSKNIFNINSNVFFYF